MLVVHVANKKFYRYKKLGNLRYQLVKHGNPFTFFFLTLSHDNLKNLHIIKYFMHCDLEYFVTGDESSKPFDRVYA